MKMYTLKQLKKKDIAINVRTKEEAKSLLKKCDDIGICRGNRDIDYMFGYHKNKLCFKIDKSEPSLIQWCSTSFYKERGNIIITPDQIDWGEDKQAEAGKVGIYLTPSSAKFTPETILSLPAPKQDNTPAVFTKAQKDWNAFKAFVKEIEMHGRGLTSNQLKTFMAKVRKDMGEQK